MREWDGGMRGVGWRDEGGGEGGVGWGGGVRGCCVWVVGVRVVCVCDLFPPPFLGDASIGTG